MNRVWLCISMLLVFLAGPQWLASPARGENDTPYPSADTGYDGQNACPYAEKMRAYGECQWYYDQEYHHGAMPDVTGEVTDVEPSDSVGAEVEAADEATPTAEAPAANATAGPADCWYDGATDSYHDYEFSNADMICEETAEAATETEAAETYAAEAAEEATDTDDDWSGSYEFPSETAVCEDPVEESYRAEDPAEADSGDESMSYGDTSESELADTQSTETMEASEEVMEGTWNTNTADAEADESPAAWPSGGYDDNDSVNPYRYDDGRHTYGAPVPTWGEPGENVEAVEGEDSEQYPASSAAVEFDSDVILSLARTLDRVGVTLRSFSHYLTEMATADLAKRHSESLER